jgi:dephospho-CoA kinase
MIIVGLTGGIGSGKTTVANFFVELGVPVYNSDEEAKRLMVDSKPIKKAIIELLGKKAYKGKKLNKKYISTQIFTDSSLLRKMNGLVHPAVRKDFLAWAEEQKVPYVIQESALIFENSQQDFYDSIILVTAPMNKRIERVMKRDGLSEKEVFIRLKNQLQDSEKESFSDYVLENTELSKTKLKVAEIHKALLDNS